MLSFPYGFVKEETKVTYIMALTFVIKIEILKLDEKTTAQREREREDSPFLKYFLWLLPLPFWPELLF